MASTTFLLMPAFLLIGCMLAPFILVLLFACLFTLLFIRILLLHHRRKMTPLAVEQRDVIDTKLNAPIHSSISLLDQMRSHWTYRIIAHFKLTVMTGLQIASGLGALWRAGGLSKIRRARTTVTLNSPRIAADSSNKQHDMKRNSHRNGSTSDKDSHNNDDSITGQYLTDVPDTNHQLSNKSTSALSLQRKSPLKRSNFIANSQSTLMGVAFLRRPTTTMIKEQRILPTALSPKPSILSQRSFKGAHASWLTTPIPSKVSNGPRYRLYAEVDSVQ
ncbi:hypothetical protein BDF19DRAFT_146141 [Syncephalis fuscata]|nr:hypothetical protein BDF19DRAFT_146141 [Syncephalis fuscata]